MNLFSDNRINELILNVKQKRRKRSIELDEIPKMFFICGKQIFNDSGTKLPKGSLKNNIRLYILEYINKKYVDIGYGSEKRRVISIISEKLYDNDLANDILSFEEVLAEISDKIIIIPESAGSYCELGAFAISDSIIDKLIVINKDNKKYAKSFITLGPLKKIKNKAKDNNDNRIITHYGLEYIKNSTSFKETINEIINIPVNICPNNNYDDISLKFLMYEFCNILELFQPLEQYEVIKIYKQICDIDKYTIRNHKKHKIRSFEQVIELMEKMTVIEKKKGYYCCSDLFSSYNSFFAINRKEYNEIRLDYLTRIKKIQPNRYTYYVN